MYVRSTIRWQVVLREAWRHLLLFATYATLVCVVYGPLGYRILFIPWQPVATLGVAVAFYIGFKNNGSYGRFQEARQLWGGIVNASRTWGAQVLGLVGPPVDEATGAAGSVALPDAAGASDPALDPALATVARRLMHRQIGWCNALRLHLRRQPQLWEREVAPWLAPAEAAAARAAANPPAQLLRFQALDLRALRRESHLLIEREHLDMLRTVEVLYGLQGGCERIKNTPFPRQYAFYSAVFVWLFAALLPLGLVGEFARSEFHHLWLTVPFSTLVSWVFHTMELTGHNSENPFEHQPHDVPMTALCRTIEIDLRQFLHDPHVPPPIQPQHDVLH